ncbi:MAG: hypothetical protein HONBIEJF_03022 [Fimbriimonadaceae bacterium]|nr:hypothetical protein [Fimbriimonadaceae bacterium]
MPRSSRIPVRHVTVSRVPVLPEKRKPVRRLRIVPLPGVTSDLLVAMPCLSATSIARASARGVTRLWRLSPLPSTARISPFRTPCVAQNRSIASAEARMVSPPPADINSISARRLSLSIMQILMASANGRPVMTASGASVRGAGTTVCESATKSAATATGSGCGMETGFGGGHDPVRLNVLRSKSNATLAAPVLGESSIRRLELAGSSHALSDE